MASSVRHGELDHAAPRDAIAGTRRDLVERIHALHREQLPAGRDQVLRLRDEIGEVGEGARDHDVEACARASIARRARTRPRRWRARAPSSPASRNAALLVARIEQRHRAGRAARSRAESREGPRRFRRRARVCAPSRCGSTERLSSTCSTTICSGLAHRREVVHAVPLRDQLEVCRELRARGIGQREAHRREALGDPCFEGHADFSVGAACRPAGGASGGPAAARSPRASRPGCARPGRPFPGRCWRELLLDFPREAAHGGVVDVGGDARRLPARAGARPRPSGARCSPRTWPRSPPARRPAVIARQPLRQS